MGTFRNRKVWDVLLVMAAAAMLGAVVFLTSGCGTASNAASGPQVFTYSEQSDPVSIDPALTSESAGGNIDRYLFEGLVSYDPQTGETKPAVAESWDVNSDATEFTFHLKQGLKFSDGQDVTANDFVYAWTRALDPGTGSPMAAEVMAPIKGAQEFANGQAKTLAGVTAPDKYTLKVTLVTSMAEFPTSLGHPVFSPVPQKEVERKDMKFAEMPTGNGPFLVKEWRHNDQITLEKNPDYTGAASPKLDQVIVKIIPSPPTALAELKAGNVDAIKGVDPGQTESLKSDSSVHLFQGKSNMVKFLGFDNTKPPFDNAKVRQAFTLLIDRNTIVDKVLQGQQNAADGTIPNTVFGYQGGVMPDYDPEKGKSLLADAGFPGGKGLPALTLAYPDVPQAADVATAVQSELKSAGVQVEIKGMEMPAFLDAMTSGQLNLFLMSWQADSPGLDGFLYPLLDSETVGATNVFQYSNHDVDKLIAKARASTDTTERNNIYNDAERKAMADAPLVPIAFGMDTLVYAPRVTNFVYTPLGDIALDQITVSNK